MTHRLSNIRQNRAHNFIADCSECGIGVKIKVIGHTMKLRAPKWRCLAELAVKARENVRADRKRARRPRKKLSAIKAVEGKRALRHSELIKLLDVELSRICRERDGYICFLTGKYCVPGVGPGFGNAAHWLPRNDVPFWLRYDPRVVFWCEGVAHAEFDGRMSRFNRVAHQAFAWGKLQREKPEIFELLTGTDWKHQERKPVKIHELREKLEDLRRWKP